MNVYSQAGNFKV